MRCRHGYYWSRLVVAVVLLAAWVVCFVNLGDSLVDFTTTVSGYEWLDDFGRRAADQILTHREGFPVVVGHADWYAGNMVVADGALVGTYDWELVPDTEAVIAGFSAACHAQRQTSAGGLSAP